MNALVPRELAMFVAVPKVAVNPVAVSGRPNVVRGLLPAPITGAGLTKMSSAYLVVAPIVSVAVIVSI